MIAYRLTGYPEVIGQTPGGSEEARLRAGLRPPPKLHVRFSRIGRVLRSLLPVWKLYPALLR